MDNGELYYFQEVLLFFDDGGFQGGGILGGDLVLEVFDRVIQVVVVFLEFFRYFQRVFEVFVAGYGQLIDVVIKIY